MISILVPTFGRPDRLRSVATNALDNTDTDCEVVFIVEADDDDTMVAAFALDDEFPEVRCVVNDRTHNYAGACNTAYQRTTGEWLFCGADDLRFHSGWDRAALRTGAPVVGTNDLLNPYVLAGTHATHYLAARSYLDGVGGVADGGPGSFLNEAYDHNYTDTEFIDTARFRGAFKPCLESVVEHVHFAAGKATMDDTYVRGQSLVSVDAELYRSRWHLWGGISNHGGL